MGEGFFFEIFGGKNHEIKLCSEIIQVGRLGVSQYSPLHLQTGVSNSNHNNA